MIGLIFKLFFFKYHLKGIKARSWILKDTTPDQIEFESLAIWNNNEGDLQVFNKRVV